MILSFEGNVINDALIALKESRLFEDVFADGRRALLASRRQAGNGTRRVEVMKVVTGEEMQRIDRRAIRGMGIPAEVLIGFGRTIGRGLYP